MKGDARLRRLLLLLLFAWSTLGIAQPALSTGQVLYLPIYSHIAYGDPDRKDAPRTLLLSALVSIRNTDPDRPIRVTSAQYYDTDGRKLKQFVPAPVTIRPMGTYEVFIAKSDSAGGSGANFLISWSAEAPANPPMVEAVHAEVLGTRSLAFVTSARPIVAK
ncbi:MAG: DUF3124 domain-containing protein [Betaproteobacteria bacterium]|nr:DUF3124 domain-containing protein [Betaproteobacteria bacterium]MBI2961183.1 DUF3124 domain-containing protein [Betaproteobacteria bacterium]